MMTTVFQRTGFVALMLMALTLSACGNKNNNTNTESTDTKPGTEATKGGKKVLNIAVGGDPETLDPGKMSGAPEGKIAFNIFEGLWMPAQKTGAPVMGNAESHNVSEDGKTWTIKLRKNAKWSNGDPVTAHDYAYAWDRVTTSGFDADYAEFMDFIQGANAKRTGKEGAVFGVKAVDDHTIEIKLKSPTPFFSELLAFYTFFPVHKATVEKHGDKWTRAENIVSNGPYRMKEYKHQQYIVLEKNPHYWDMDNVKIDEVKILIIKDNTSTLNAFKEGSIDIMSSGIPIGKLPVWKGKPEFRLDPLLGTYYYRVNVTDNPALGKKEVRQALSQSIDRKSLATLTMKGLYAPAKGFVPPMPDYTSPSNLTFNPKKARELMANAGFPKGEGFPEITILFNNDENHKLIAEIVQDTWKRELGISVKLENKEWKTYLGDIDKLSYQIARAGWIGDYNDPTTFLGIFTTGNGNNDTGWGNPEFDKHIKDAYAATDTAQRLKLLQDAERILMEDAPIIPIYFYKSPLLISKRVVGHKPHNRDVHLIKYMDVK